MRSMNAPDFTTLQPNVRCGARVLCNQHFDYYDTSGDAVLVSVGPEPRRDPSSK